MGVQFPHPAPIDGLPQVSGGRAATADCVGRPLLPLRVSTNRDCRQCAATSMVTVPSMTVPTTRTFYKPQFDRSTMQATFGCSNRRTSRRERVVVSRLHRDNLCKHG